MRRRGVGWVTGLRVLKGRVREREKEREGQGSGVCARKSVVSAAVAEVRVEETLGLGSEVQGCG